MLWLKISSPAHAKSSTYGPVTVTAPEVRGSIKLCPPKGFKLPPTNATVANE